MGYLNCAAHCPAIQIQLDVHVRPCRCLVLQTGLCPVAAFSSPSTVPAPAPPPPPDIAQLKQQFLL